MHTGQTHAAAAHVTRIHDPAVSSPRFPRVARRAARRQEALVALIQAIIQLDEVLWKEIDSSASSEKRLGAVLFLPEQRSGGVVTLSGMAGLAARQEGARWVWYRNPGGQPPSRWASFGVVTCVLAGKYGSIRWSLLRAARGGQSGAVPI
ncbi:hypothetical protein VTN96DRAFT_8881 [Rasamsonia emersonii]